MKTSEIAVSLPVWVEPPQSPSAWGIALRFCSQCLTLVEMELRKLRRDPSDIAMRAIQPALWLVVFGNVFSRIHAIPTGDLNYLDFLAPGTLAQGVLFISIFYGISVIWERDLGVVHKLLVSPTPRVALVLGKALSAGVRALSQAVMIYALAWWLGVHLNGNPLALAGVAITVVLGAAAFSLFSLMIASIVKTRERFMGIGQVLTMPLFFASNAVYPIDIMPGWLRFLARLNPLTYEVDALRALMVRGGVSHFGLLVDFAVLSAIVTLLTLASARLYAHLVH